MSKNPRNDDVKNEFEEGAHAIIGIVENVEEIIHLGSLCPRHFPDVSLFIEQDVAKRKRATSCFLYLRFSLSSWPLRNTSSFGKQKRFYLGLKFRHQEFNLHRFVFLLPPFITLDRLILRRIILQCVQIMTLFGF